jgi:hypothetical protein
LSAEQVEVIRAEAGHRTLCELAVEFGVSHETIRKVVCDRIGQANASRALIAC